MTYCTSTLQEVNNGKYVLNNFFLFSFSYYLLFDSIFFLVYEKRSAYLLSLIIIKIFFHRLNLFYGVHQDIFVILLDKLLNGLYPFFSREEFHKRLISISANQMSPSRWMVLHVGSLFTSYGTPSLFYKNKSNRIFIFLILTSHFFFFFQSSQLTQPN